MRTNYSMYTILVVDDIPTNALLLKILLEEQGFQIVTASDGKEALELLDSIKPDLVLLDVLMPVMDGFEALQQLRSLPAYKSLPVILLTALDSTEDIIKGFSLGAHDYVTKPFNKEELLMRVKHQIDLLAAQNTIEQRNQALRKSIKNRDELYSVVAHDLRTPMSSLKMLLNTLMMYQEKEQASEEFTDLLQSANELSENLFVLLDNLLKWTRTQLGKLKPVAQNISFADLVQGLVEVYEPIAQLKDIQIKFSKNGDAQVFFDREMLKSIVRNLLINAIKFSYTNSLVCVQVDVNSEFATLRIIDTGCGISEENKKKLFDTDIHFTTFGTNNESGSGLGLLLVAKFLKVNNTNLFFDSTEGEGSTFGFTLPIYKPD